MNRSIHVGPMQKYRYAGPVSWLKGCTALGFRHGDNFVVQVDQYVSDWWHHWHSTPRRHWRILE